MTISFHCDVCGRETSLENVRLGRKIFCHCGHKITDCYDGQVGTADVESGTRDAYDGDSDANDRILELSDGAMDTIEGTFELPDGTLEQESGTREGVNVPQSQVLNSQSSNFQPAGHNTQLTIADGNVDNPKWKTEPYIRINWRRIGYSIFSLGYGISHFITKQYQAICQRFKKDKKPGRGNDGSAT